MTSMQQKLVGISVIVLVFLGYVRASADDYSYCIVVHDSLANVVQPLADWKNEKGCSTFVAKISWIEANYQGRDRAEKIRNFVAHSDSIWLSFEYLLLAGDCGTIPPRYVMLYWYEDSCPTPCDDYYANLATNWDLDNDSIFGEDSSECALGIDEIDFNYSLCVGRLPSDNREEMENMVNKIINYEKYPLPGDWPNRMIFCAGFGQFADSSDFIYNKENIYTSGFPHPNNFQIARLYESIKEDFDSLSINSFLGAFNQGASIVNIYSHGQKEYFMWATKIDSDSVWVVGDCIYAKHDSLFTNGDKLPIILANSCHTACFDYDKKCLGEAFMTAPNGGCIIYLGSARYNFIPEFHFYPYFFGITNQCAGKAFRMAKQSGMEVWGRFSYLTSVMFGDPELQIRTLVVGIEEIIPTRPTQKTIVAIYPNPFTQEAIIRYSLTENPGNYMMQDSRLTISDIAGRLIWEFQIPDSRLVVNEIRWDGRDKKGEKVQTGIYFCKLSGSGSSVAKKIVLVR